jgi:hypothetical protein
MSRYYAASASGISGPEPEIERSYASSRSVAANQLADFGGQGAQREGLCHHFHAGVEEGAAVS